MELLQYALELAKDFESSRFPEVFQYAWWVYPAFNTGHILGLAMLFGSIVSLDLRMIGMWRSIPLYDMARPLTRIALFGALIAITTGVFLLSVKARIYVSSPIFWAKSGFLMIALLNALLLRFNKPWRYLSQVDSRGTIPRFKSAGLVSLMSWTGMLICGRFFGYI
ncbi:hypothetical protein PsAD2_01130 [Pseudovibrio axinellae]|uniref:DUF2214 domain-containing protein n=1 Tax=Pseudovibrio axinellae TaxID=989403 RepID=A0A166A5K8_9HYPH|nr:hypothetical protein [Pseudovibrio axinellae]KZL20644.1 hypothetical protein PsAD2_01130 [Pseudovibrio axinellae]SER27011.1 hypothetical protein SAMN05421798_107247 [Pseudovibrio axinellae]